MPRRFAPNGTVTILTDFGLADTYAGAVKGSILSIAPSATLVDLTHQVPRQNVPTGAFLLGAAWQAFPPGTAHLAVVDPDVGTERRPLVLVGKGHAFVGPDNGLFTYVLWPDLLPREHRRPLAPFRARLPQSFTAIVLDCPDYWRHPVSATFHARDVFGPVAAHLAAGFPPRGLGTPTDEVTVLYAPRAEWKGASLAGTVLHVDIFGNLVTNIRTEQVAGKSVAVTLGRRTIATLSATYGRHRRLVVVPGSHGFLEIALPQGNAAKALGACVGTAVIVRQA